MRRLRRRAGGEITLYLPRAAGVAMDLRGARSCRQGPPTTSSPPRPGGRRDPARFREPSLSPLRTPCQTATRSSAAWRHCRRSRPLVAADLGDHSVAIVPSRPATGVAGAGSRTRQPDVHVLGLQPLATRRTSTSRPFGRSCGSQTRPARNIAQAAVTRVQAYDPRGPRSIERVRSTESRPPSTRRSRSLNPR